MGNNISLRRNQRNIPSTISYFTNSFGLYFGPYFIMNRNDRNVNTRARNLINEQVQNNIMSGTGLLWSDLLEAMENGVITEQELSDFGISFGQTQISEYDAPITIQSLVNLHKHSIKLSKVKYKEGENRENTFKNPLASTNIQINNDMVNEKKDECVIQIDSLTKDMNNMKINNSDYRVNLEFEYDSYTPCQIHLFWNAREVIVKNGNERKAIYLLNHNENRNSMTIGPLPAGNNQKFVLPDGINIPVDVINDIIIKTTVPDEIPSSRNSKNFNSNDNISSNNEDEDINNVNIDNTVNIRVDNNDDNNATPTNETLNNNELVASTSTNPNPDNSDHNRRLRLRRNIFNHGSRNSSRSTSRSRNSSKKEMKEKKIVWFPLIMVLEALENKNEKPNDHAIKYQTTFLKLEINNESDQYHIKSVDQKVMIKNNLYRLQEIYGFTDVSDAEQVVTNEVNSSIECVICLSEPRNTIVLPCRHLCVCQDCADILCNQSRNDRRSSYLSTPRCPICRQIFHSFLRINMDYFNLSEEEYEKSAKIVTEDNTTEGKKNCTETNTEKQYNIIATSRMNEDDEKDEEENNTNNNNDSNSIKKNDDSYNKDDNESEDSYHYVRHESEEFNKSIFDNNQQSQKTDPITDDTLQNESYVTNKGDITDITIEVNQEISEYMKNNSISNSQEKDEFVNTNDINDENIKSNNNSINNSNNNSISNSNNNSINNSNNNSINNSNNNSINNSNNNSINNSDNELNNNDNSNGPNNQIEHISMESLD
ncbi:hypothetical protein BCR32DRAFT_292644 [Anaeromyces robustus]|uniref:RING-type domain-containing protein n=1 Tax=Anaeromyces robustus TaxID=1754192 RepID=A0A1Y1X9J1_9FUNG|nr:hypothetical protein BCR32DRAFT_292644 [Anaeromyces robustus]|eukprot:ORX82413.1 hypothetical protein BCR32DRAFT_292644 [Anaeromyces robustus]